MEFSKKLMVFASFMYVATWVVMVAAIFKAKEILCSILTSYHNLHFLHKMMLDSRAAIRENKFSDYKKAFLCRYQNRGDR